MRQPPTLELHHILEAAAQAPHIRRCTLAPVGEAPQQQRRLYACNRQQRWGTHGRDSGWRPRHVLPAGGARMWLLLYTLHVPNQRQLLLPAQAPNMRVPDAPCAVHHDATVGQAVLVGLQPGGGVGEAADLRVKQLYLGLHGLSMCETLT